MYNTPRTDIKFLQLVMKLAHEPTSFNSTHGNPRGQLSFTSEYTYSDDSPSYRGARLVYKLFIDGLKPSVEQLLIVQLLNLLLLNSSCSLVLTRLSFS